MPIFQIRSFLSYYLKATTIYHIHSPVLYEIADAIRSGNRKGNGLFKNIEDQRKKLLQNHGKIQVTDFGAGTKGSRTRERKISEIARYSLSQARQCRIIHQLIRLKKPGKILELGTAFGISTAYMATAHPGAEVTTIDGDPRIMDIAGEVWKNLGILNITGKIGDIGETLADVPEENEGTGFAFLDGNHAYAPTIAYFRQIINHMPEGGILIVDDIYWSREMADAWQFIKNDPAIRASVDCFYFGVAVTGTPAQAKQDVVYIDWKWKPWKLGIWG